MDLVAGVRPLFSAVYSLLTYDSHLLVVVDLFTYRRVQRLLRITKSPGLLLLCNELLLCGECRWPGP